MSVLLQFFPIFLSFCSSFWSSLRWLYLQVFMMALLLVGSVIFHFPSVQQVYLSLSTRFLFTTASSSRLYKYYINTHTHIYIYVYWPECPCELGWMSCVRSKSKKNTRETKGSWWHSNGSSRRDSTGSHSRDRLTTITDSNRPLHRKPVFLIFSIF